MSKPSWPISGVKYSVDGAWHRLGFGLASAWLRLGFGSGLNTIKWLLELRAVCVSVLITNDYARFSFDGNPT
ncbi:hypothetical protein [Arenicella sp. 4NH20-0111]|uniref:hypothetical protein n=1 Tax=Arenicella sp. 4NH20-0111 TaxID=3127648 RepID=UPI00333E3507